MLNVTPLSADYAPRQLELMRNTVARDCSSEEFNLFVAAARRAGLDPFRRQISAIVFNKKSAEKRRMAIITTIDGLRSIAGRSLRYRPDDQEPSFTYDPDLKGPTNPLGIDRVMVRVYIRDQGGNEWHPVVGVAYWSEFAPVADEWVDDERTGSRKPSGRQFLDPKSQWAKMPRLMLAKCAEAIAIRRAFPEDLSGLYEASEVDRQRLTEAVLPTDLIDADATQQRLDRIGVGGRTITFQFHPVEPLEQVPVGQVADRALAAYRSLDARQKAWFESVNRAGLQEFWALSPTDALGLKSEMERLRAAGTDAA
jgi:phage recombination protein Bet